MQDGLVWDLLLQELFLDQSVVLKLMCCSRSMLELVHSKCEGMLAVTVSAVHDSSRPPAVLTSWPQHHAFGRWLARHARLCSSIDIKLTQQSLPTINSHPPSLQQAASAFDVLNAVMAAGWQAAASGPGSVRPEVPALHMTRRQAAPVASLYHEEPAAATAAVTAAALGSSSSTSGQALPLTGFASDIPRGEKILLGLAGCTQLTRLELCLSDREATRAAFASLTGLKKLVLGLNFPEHARKSHDRFMADAELDRSLHALRPALRSLTCLTCCALGGVPAQRSLNVLPVSLVELTLGSQVPQRHGRAVVKKLAHLTNVTKLQLPVVFAKSTLPPLLSLLACNLRSVQPLLPLGRLEQLSIWQPHCLYATAMRQLSALTQVTRLSATCRRWHVAELTDMPDLPPLRKLTVKTFAGHKQVTRNRCNALFGLELALCNRQSELGLGEHLTCLVLQDLRLQMPEGNLALQLKALPALEELRLVRVYALLPVDPACAMRCYGDGAAPIWEELICAVSCLKSLRSFVACEVELGDAAAGLAAATQLTNCELVGCGLSEAAEAELRARPAWQMTRSRLEVR